MQFASTDDLAAIGGIKVDEAGTSPNARRAIRLVELASAQAAAYLRLADQDAFDALPDVQREVITAVVAEAATARLSVSGAANVNQWPPDDVTWASAMLAPRHYRALDRAFGRPGSTGSVSLETGRAAESSWVQSFDGAR